MMKIRGLFILLILWNGAFAQLSGKVVGISDGDTFTLLTEEKQRVRIRVFGIDCPESGQDFGKVAKQFTSDFIFSKEVYIVIKDTGRYDRIVGVIYTLPDSACLNEELLKSGLAWHYSYFDRNNTTWDNLEKKARTEKKGLWQRADAVAPWLYRKQNEVGYK